MAALTIRHTTSFTYRRPVAFGTHHVMVRPRDSADQSVLEANLHISPAPSQIQWAKDSFGNHVASVQFRGKAERLRFESIVHVEHVTEDFAELEPGVRDALPLSYTAGERAKLDVFLQSQYADADGALSHWVGHFLAEQRPAGLQDLLIKMTAAIKTGFTYAAREAKGIQTPAQTLALRSGSCRDFAVLMIEALKTLGVAARFVSGYVHVRYDPNERRSAGSTHAWLQAYVPGRGWVDFDPTNGITGNRDLIRVAVVHDPHDAVPLHGTWIGESTDAIGMDVEVSVTPTERQVFAEADNYSHQPMRESALLMTA
ncbi:transglutaminase family protein [Beijerinckia indica]|uniref:Transglutaminase domain protein n=1 Tax=Beijerinckia indica subsp. indica (strain ATCC 9039 / DSM 1715 / NCIMB 8712) TaxID=395963 RepID=B2IIC3_BEII9|nr:transglutaminase family protein [Beijerinckia indica]ACB96077.1 transglutaminase domain protein [Beijerinckia indica subsp. indica ATCC 9039]